MQLKTLSRLGIKHAKNAFAESLYLKSNVDITQPISFSGLVNEHCNVRCRYCDYWRLKEYQDELTIEEWQNALLSIKAFVGEYSINFSGGEPFLKRGFIDLLQFCHQQGIHSGVTTNGSCLTKAVVKNIVATHPFNINISVDAPNSDIHDYLRGFPGLFNTLSQGIHYLVEERNQQNQQFPIVIKTTITAKNFRYLPAMVDWVEEIGATAVHFQPLTRKTEETYNELWIEEDDLNDLAHVSDQLVNLKRNGAPIMNSEHFLKLLGPYFSAEDLNPPIGPNRTGLRTYIIKTNGEIFLSTNWPSIGNVKHQSAREIWYGQPARQLRKESISAHSKSWMNTTEAPKTLTDKFRMGWQLLKA